jgi:hypothetical protein
MDTASQNTVRLDAVWHQFVSPTSAGAGGAATAMVSLAVLRAEESVSRVLDAMRRVAERNEGVALRPTRSSERLIGAGESVEVRGVFLVGEASKSGKSPRGWERVETIVARKSQVYILNEGVRGGLCAEQLQEECRRVVVMSQTTAGWRSESGPAYPAGLFLRRQEVMEKRMD